MDDTAMIPAIPRPDTPIANGQIQEQEKVVQEPSAATPDSASTLHNSAEIPHPIASDAPAPAPLVIASKPTWPLEQTQPAITGYVGLLTLTLAAAFTAVNREAPYFNSIYSHLPLSQVAMLDSCVMALWDWRYAILFALGLLSMVAVEVLYVKSYRRHFNFAAPKTLDREAWARIVARGLGLMCCFVPITFLYVYLGEYSFYELNYKAKWYYSHFHTLFITGVPVVLLLCWPYFYALERFGIDDGLNDELLTVARWIHTPMAQIRSGEPHQRHQNAHVANFARTLIVKFFFIPVMVAFWYGNWTSWEYRVHQFIQNLDTMHWEDVTNVAVNFHSCARAVYAYILLIDVSLGLMGYLASTRLLDTQVVTAEPTLFGWMVALLCYPPIQRGVTAIYLEYSSYDIWPIALFREHPTLSILMTFISLLLMGIYSWATVAFGLRFSNLTNRGVVCSGPYKWVRHPAYICKNTSWWLDALPSMILNPAMTPIYIMRLVATNTLYGLRAITEERHLMREPHYQEYCKKVPWRFLPGLW